MRAFVLFCLSTALLSGCNDNRPPLPVHGILGSVASNLGSSQLQVKPAVSEEEGTTDPDQLLERAVDLDLAGENHRQIFDQAYAALAPTDKQTLDGLIQAAQSNTERMLILKTFAAAETMANVQTYAQEIRGKSEQEIIDKSTMRGDDTLIQQYQQTCGLAMVQVASSEYDPRYAWEMHKLGDVHAIDPAGPIAKQQVDWLHRYGGQESPRGVEGGKEIGILGPLNDMVGAFVHCSFTCETTPDVDAALASIASQVKAGFPAPIRVAFAGDLGHFMLIEAAKDGRYRVYDPYYGKVRWMTPEDFKSGNLVPDNGNKAYLTHWYRSTPR